MRRRNIELVLPGGDLFRVKIAFLYGADAVYIGLDKHSLRKAGVNFTIADMKKAIDYAHSIGKKIYVTFNIFAHNKQLAEIEKDMKKIAALSPDAFIMADPGVMRIAKKVAPKIPIHVSTQANTTNIEDVKFWRDMGVKRVVLARELTLKEIAEIHKDVPEVELEVFVHGAMCISYSGRCLLSNYMTGRAANLGECAQPCRWNYNVYSTCHSEESRKSGRRENLDCRVTEVPRNDFYLEEQLRPGEYFPIVEGEHGTTIMSSRDLRLVRYLPEILKAGVTGLKVEGRNKTEYYLATTASTYKNALNLIEAGKYNEKAKKEAEKELEKLNFRGYTEGFIFGAAQKGETYEGRSGKEKWQYTGLINKTKDIRQNGHEVIVKNKISKNDKVEILSPDGIFEETILNIFDENKKELSEISPGKEGQKAIIELTKSYPEKSIIRKIR